MNFEKVVIIIPTYNEALIIEKTLSEVFQAASAIANMDIHVLIFDSHSTDNTQEIVVKLQESNKKLHLLTEPKKSGLGSAYLQAMRYALTTMAADIVMEFDADLSHQPKYLAPMLKKMKHYDVVIGSRYIKGGSIPKNWAWHRKLLSIVGNYTARRLLTSKYCDLTSGFRATRSHLLKAILPDAFLSNHYAYKLQLFWLLHQHKARIYEYPIEFIDRQQGVSKLPTNSITDALKVLIILRFQAFSCYVKMSLVGMSGLVIQCITYNLLRFNLSSFNAAQLAVVVAMISNFILNSRLTFKERHHYCRSQKIKSFTLFIMYSILMINLQSYWLQIGSDYLGSSVIKDNALVILGALLGSLLNYVVYSRLVWRKPSMLWQKC